MKKWSFLSSIILFQFLLFCTAPNIEVSKTLIKQNEYRDTIFKTDNALHEDSTNIPLAQISVKNWVGKSFLVLEKQQVFCQNGYELFYCTGIDTCHFSDNTAVLKPHNRVPCNELRGHTLVVNGVQEIEGEWLVMFSDMQTQKGIMGKTYKQCLKEIVPEVDLIWARKHWQNRFVFARKGVISTISKDRTSFGSIKVRIQDSLRVVDVIPGFTPLPVNPIWLIVKTPQGQEGMIPVRSSWTNTMSDKIGNSNAWSADILESDPTKIFSWDEIIWEIINNHRVALEMSRDQVLLSWGEPLKCEPAEYNGEKRERWLYAAQSLYFDQDQLIAIENAQ